MKNRLRSFIAAAAVLAALFGIAGCGDSDMTGKLFRFNNNADPKTLDPAMMRGVPEMTVALGLFEGLTSYDPQTLKPVPGIAEKWEISSDGLTYTFHLRESTWSNGEPLTAEDFVYSWRRVLDPATAAEYANQLWFIKNAAAFTKGTLHDFSQVGVQAPNAKTIVVTLESPTPYFLELLAFATYMPVNRACVERYGSDEWFKPGKIVSNGPFVLKRWGKDEKIVLRRNPNYWRAADVKLDGVVIYSIGNENTAFSRYETGELDWLRNIPDIAAKELLGRADFYRCESLGTNFYRFNCSRKPFDDPRVRKAFALAVDKKQLCERTLYGQFSPADSLVPPVFDDYKSPPGLSYDPKRAAELLAEAGYPGGKGFPPVNLTYNTSSDRHRIVAERIQKLWSENLHVEVNLVGQSWGVYLSSMKEKNYDIIRSGWIGDYLDPLTFLDLFTSTNLNNQTGWANPTYDDLVAKASRATDSLERATLYQEAERILLQDDVPALMLFYDANIGLVRPNVKGFHLNSRNIHPFQNIDIAE